ncbi:MAG: efflux RND transporter periplasmic adaptor subunit [Saprospiraceae bacterium]
MKNIFSMILSAILLLAISSCGNKSEHSTTETTSAGTSALKIKTMPVKDYTSSGTISVLGIVISEQEVKPSFKTGGVIRRTFVKEGDAVRKGQLLADLTMTEINAQVQQADEFVSKAARDLQRVTNLYRDSVATLEQFQNAQMALTLAKKQKEIADFNRSYSEVRSPVDGKVVRQILHEGEITGPGTPVCVIIGTGNSDWVIRAGLSDRDWARVNQGDTASVMMDAFPGEKMQALVTQLSSASTSASNTFDVELRFIHTPPRMAAGLTAHINLQPRQQNKFKLIPSDALIRSNGQWAYAFTIENGKAKKIKLQIADLLGDETAISEGLEGIHEVITTGAMYLEEGDDVQQ